MLDLSDIIKKAETAPRQTADIEVIFDAGISQELETLRTEQQQHLAELEQIDADLTAELELLDRDRRASDPRPAAARKRAAKASATVQGRLDELSLRIDAVQERAADFLVTFRVTALHGFEWDEITSRSVPREGHPEDAARNWNVDEVTRLVAARSTVRIGGDGEVIEVTAEQWAGIWKTLPSLGRRHLRQTIWILNEYAMIAARDEAVIAARKVSAARQAATLTSPSTSVSTRDASPGGNPSPSPTTSTTSEAA